MRAHAGYIRDGALQPGVFKTREGGMSVDWCKYATPEQTLMRAPKPWENAVIEMNVGRVRSIPTLDVRHTPELGNQAHCDIPLPEPREELTEVRFHLKRIAMIVIPLNPLPA